MGCAPKRKWVSEFFRERKRPELGNGGEQIIQENLITFFCNVHTCSHSFLKMIRKWCFFLLRDSLQIPHREKWKPFFRMGRCRRNVISRKVGMNPWYVFALGIRGWWFLDWNASKGNGDFQAKVSETALSPVSWIKGENQVRSICQVTFQIENNLCQTEHVLKLQGFWRIPPNRIILDSETSISQCTNGT